jgi:hypothetical protein
MYSVLSSPSPSAGKYVGLHADHTPEVLPVAKSRLVRTPDGWAPHASECWSACRGPVHASLDTSVIPAMSSVTFSRIKRFSSISLNTDAKPQRLSSSDPDQAVQFN